jgi:signal peptidase I
MGDRMDERLELYKYRRRPWLAGILSLLLPGLGHVYCGKIVKGLIFTFVTEWVIPILFWLCIFVSAELSEFVVFLVLTAAWIIVSIAVRFLVAIISYRIAKRTPIDYKPKDYNCWLVYIVLLLIMNASYDFPPEYVEKFRMNSHSMYPTLIPKDTVLVNEQAYENNVPERGDLVAFRSPNDKNVIYLHRIIGIGSDSIEYKNRRYYVNEQELELIEGPPGEYIADDDMEVKGQVYYEKNGEVRYKVFLSESEPGPPDMDKITISENHFFVAGDERTHALDSRFYGPIPLNDIVGRVECIFYPSDKDWSRFGKLNKN